MNWKKKITVIISLFVTIYNSFCSLHSLSLFLCCVFIRFFVLDACLHSHTYSSIKNFTFCLNDFVGFLSSVCFIHKNRRILNNIKPKNCIEFLQQRMNVRVCVRRRFHHLTKIIIYLAFFWNRIEAAKQYYRPQ